MKPLPLCAAALLAFLTTAACQAQPASAPGAGGCTAAAASAADGPCPADHRRRHATSPDASVGHDDTPGWSLMSREERRQHREKLHSMKAYDECRSYLDKLREQMRERARKQGRSLPQAPRRDACAALRAGKP